MKICYWCKKKIDSKDKMVVSVQGSLEVYQGIMKLNQEDMGYLSKLLQSTVLKDQYAHSECQITAETQAFGEAMQIIRNKEKK